MKLRRAREFLLIRECEDPRKELQKRTTFPHEADRAWYIQLWEGNLEDRVRMQVGGKFNVPNPCKEYVDTLLREYKEILSRGGHLFQFVFKGYIYYETFEDAEEPNRPTYQEVDSVPEDWPTVKQAAREKDIDKSTVNSQIYSGDLRAVMSDGRRYIEPDQDYENWSPSRKKSYLRDRRLVIAKEVLLRYEPIHLSDLYQYIYQIEEDRFGDEQLPAGDPESEMKSFFEDVLEGVGGAPHSIWEWHQKIGMFAEFFDLKNKKKASRAFPGDLLDRMIQSASERERESRGPAGPPRKSRHSQFSSA